ncbi:outer dense fiber protein 2-like [Anarrhichthys ocellatus]|uniref:outer dense fiber protein 2-like n=1 Tax=Anarrhichthys ocellatus TaxID=433405 RepID=UPI0012EE9FD0|nr:outer dense fiber protein 2-like [Anarrhichthys ocellatus]
MERIRKQRQMVKEYQKKLEAEHHVQPKTTTKEEMEVFQLKDDLDKAKQELKNGQLQWQKEKSLYHAKAFCQAKTFYKARMDEQRVETNRIAAALKETQELLETERHVQTTTKEEMEIFKNLCQATVDEQLDVSSKLKAAFIKAEQELKNGHLQWQEEKSLHQAKAFSQAKASYQAQIDKQRVETNRIAAALKETRDLLETERHVQTTTKEEMEVFKNLCQATVDEQLDVSSKLKAAFIKAEQELKNRDLQWQEEKSSFVDQNKKASELYHAQLKTIADFGRMEKEAKQTLERFQAAHEGQLEEQRAETNKILAVLKKTEDLLEAEHLRFQEQSSLTAHLEKTCRDLNHDQLKNIATIQTLEEEATQMVKRNQASQAQLEEQRTEINRIKAARKNTEDLLETERFLWQQEKSSLLQATEDLQATEKDLKSQITNKQKKKKKWFKLF